MGLLLPAITPLVCPGQKNFEIKIMLLQLEKYVLISLFLVLNIIDSSFLVPKILYIN